MSWMFLCFSSLGTRKNHLFFLLVVIPCLITGILFPYVSWDHPKKFWFSRVPYANMKRCLFENPINSPAITCISALDFFFTGHKRLPQKKNSEFRDEVILEGFNCQKWEIKKKLKFADFYVWFAMCSSINIKGWL